MRVALVCLLWLLPACDGSSGVDGGSNVPDAPVLDAGIRDAASDAPLMDTFVASDASGDTATADTNLSDGAAEGDGGEVEAGSDAGMDAGSDAGVDAGSDAGSDAGVDAGSDAGVDAGSDAGVDAGSDAGVDAGSDAGRPDAGPPADPCVPLPTGLTHWSQSDSASSGTPDTYFFSVTPGDPFCVSIAGAGSGTWSVVVSNGTSTGVYCRDEPTCSITVPPGQMTLLVTAVTDGIGPYTLDVRYRPR